MSRYVATPKEWERLRQEKLYGQKCRGCGENATELHHLCPRSLLGDDVEGNLVPLCHACHMVFEDRASGWREVASRIRQGMKPAERMYLLWAKSPVFLDRYYPESP